MFQQIAFVDQTGLQPDAIAKLSALSQNPILTFEDNPKDKAEIIRRISNADCVFVSWGTRIDAEVLAGCSPSLRYIGMCCSLYSEESANVDIAAARSRGITVKGIRDYGDEGVVEFIIAEVIRLSKGLGKFQWKNEPVELKGRKIGIIGMGTTGQMLSRCLQAFGAKMYYYNRSRKPDAERDGGAQYLPLDELLQTVEIISLHLPRNTNVLQKEHFETFGNGKILVNTSLGLTFDKSAFEHWLKQPGNYAIMDGDGVGEFRKDLEQYENVLYTEIVSGWTMEAKQRLSQKVVENVEAYLGTQDS